MLKKLKILFLGLFPFGISPQTTIPYYQFKAPYNSPVATLTKQTDQSGQNKFCNSENGTQSYTCSFNNTMALTTYTFGMVITLWADTTGTNALIRIDNCPQVGIKDSATGQNDVTVLANQPHLLFYDGTNFRLML
jgi:hypothetical protein